MPVEETLLIVGVGLIGGSIAAAARKRGVARNVVGFGRSRERLQAGVKAGILHDAIDNLAMIPQDVSLAVVCTPTTYITGDVERLVQVLSPRAVITDAGSTKQRICRQLEKFATGNPVFLGSHPIAGSEKQGFEHASADLFENRTCVLTPLPEHSPDCIGKVAGFWQSLGMRTVFLDPSEHDVLLARTSHVPHVVAAALAETLTADDLPWVGSGLRDTTRIAAGDADLWTAILGENRENVCAGIRRVREILDVYETALSRNALGDVHLHLDAAKRLRDQLSLLDNAGMEDRYREVQNREDQNREDQNREDRGFDSHH